SADEELLDIVCVGGRNDMGIDGLAIKVNGLLVKSIEDAEGILDKFKRATVEIIFIQSKYSPKFDSGEFNKFIAGVRDFLNEDHKQPMNENIKEVLKIKDFLLSDDVVIMWEKNPTVRIYYVAMGKWRDSPHHIALAEQWKEDISQLNTFEDPKSHFVDSEALKDICDSNENTFSTSLNAIDTMALTAVKNVDDSCILICYANELTKLLTTEDKVIRKSLFNDNVRDYQGTNNVNLEIDETIREDPEKFILLNNGITIVCDEFIPSNRRITLKNPQIVNGCQTSHVLYYAKEKGINVERIPLSIKVISTKDTEVINQIVRGTNRQNIVYDEAFETTKKFHKNLEEFINAISVDYEKIYYERRSKQYHHNPLIKQTQKINVRILTQTFIAMFLNMPHKSHAHESKLLKEFANSIFQDVHSKLPYFTAALTFYKLEKYFRNNYEKKKQFYSYRAHLMMIFRELIAGKCPNIYSEKAIDSHSNQVLSVLKDSNATDEYIRKSENVFEECKSIWVSDLGKSTYGIKDIADYTKLIFKEITKSQDPEKAPKTEVDNKFKGKVLKTLVDRFGNRCGFIKRLPNDIFFHSKVNTDLNFNNLVGKYVSYETQINPRNNKEIAVEVKVE
ncbi:MAG: AIPR family protein, partial [Desulfobacula sp.]|nr:AIPR family protein [Desulfobacula sp.]